LPDIVSIHVIEIVGSVFFTLFLNFLFFINVFWGIVNLLPIYPLDGGQIAREVLLKMHPDGIRWSLMISMTVAVLLTAAALIQWNQPFVAVFFGYFAYMNYMALSYTSGGGRW